MKSALITKQTLTVLYAISPILSAIIAFKPRSVYELAKLTESDVSNLNKVIQFFEEIGVIKIKTTRVVGRKIKQPLVEYGEVTFRLAA